MVSTRVCGTLSSGSNPGRHTAKTKNIPNYFVALKVFLSRRMSIYAFLEKLLCFAHFGCFLFNRFGAYRVTVPKHCYVDLKRKSGYEITKRKAEFMAFLCSYFVTFSGGRGAMFLLSHKTKRKTYAR